MLTSDCLKSAGLFFAAWFLIIASHGAYGAGTSALGEPVNAAEAKAGTLWFGQKTSGKRNGADARHRGGYSGDGRDRPNGSDPVFS